MSSEMLGQQALPRVGHRWVKRATIAAVILLALCLFLVGLDCLVAGPVAQLGDHTHQIERSAHPSAAAAAGSPPSGERCAFLVRLVSVFRRSARVLIVHGKTSANDAQWNDCNQSLSLAFLDEESVGDPDEWMVGKGVIRGWATADRAVFHTRALN